MAQIAAEGNNDGTESTQESSPPFATESSSPTPTPLPKLQLFILLYLQLAEPITAFVVFPFINQMIYEYGMTDGDEKKVGYYAGTMNTLFFLTEMVFVLQWGRTSDRIGRRPVLLTGLCGLALSITLFGLSKTFLTLTISRALSGALNGNIGVVKVMMAEITDETNQARAFIFMPLAFAAGTSTASFIGGGLSHPYERFPAVFGRADFWRKYPYALPCFVSASFCVSAFILALLCLKESLNSKRQHQSNRNYGTSTTSNGALVYENSATTALLPKPPPPPPPSMREVLTPRVRVAILNNGTFAFLGIVFGYLRPLILSTPIPLGGLGLEAPTIGLILGISGIINGLFQVTFFTRFYRRFGIRKIFMASLASYLIIYLCWPLMSFLAKRAGKVDTSVIVVLAVQQLTSAFSGMGFSCAHIFITSAAPTRNALGATTGLSQSLVSFTRAVGPAAMASLFAFSLQHNLLGGQLVYVVLVLLVLLAFVLSSRLPKVITRASDQRAR